MFQRIRNLIRKELIQLGRDWVLCAFIITLPALQLVLLAHSTGSDIVGLDVIMVDRDRSAASRRIVESLGNREHLEIHSFHETVEEAEQFLEAGSAVLVVVIPEGFSEALGSRADESTIQLIVDGSNDLVADVALGAAKEALTEFAADETRSLGGIPESVIDLRTTVRYNPTFDIKLYTIPAQLGFIVYQVTLAVASVGLARERELGTLEQLIVMPLTRLELMVGKAAPALIVGMINFFSMLAITVWGFGVPMRGSLWLLLGFTFLFVVAEIGYGVCISAVARTQQQAILLVFVLAMVDMSFSGYLVPTESLPQGLRLISRFVPLGHYLTVIRSVMLKSAGPGTLWPHAVAVFAVGIVVAGVAARSLSHHLD